MARLYTGWSLGVAGSQISQKKFFLKKHLPDAGSIKRFLILGHLRPFRKVCGIKVLHLPMQLLRKDIHDTFARK